MPSEDENIRFLYLILTINGSPSALIDWDAVGAALALKKGAVTKRWSRLQKAIKDGANPGPSAHEFLWLLVKHTNGEAGKSFDWKVIANACNTTPGAASKRFSRLKQAQAAGASFVKGSENPNESAAPQGEASGKAANISKRKRADSASPTNDADAVPSPGQGNAEQGQADDNETAQPTPKRKRKAPATKAKSPAKSKADGGLVKTAKARKTTKVKQEVVEEDEGQGQYGDGQALQDGEEGHHDNEQDCQDDVEDHQDDGQVQDAVITQELRENPVSEHDTGEDLEYTPTSLGYYQNPVPQNDLSGWRQSRNEYAGFSAYDLVPGYSIPHGVARNMFGDVV